MRMDGVYKIPFPMVTCEGALFDKTETKWFNKTTERAAAGNAL